MDFLRQDFSKNLVSNGKVGSCHVKSTLIKLQTLTRQTKTKILAYPLTTFFNGLSVQ